ncbi:NAC domain-containing protein [Tanacetum coccineum]
MCCFQGTLKGYLKEALGIESNTIELKRCYGQHWPKAPPLRIEETKGTNQYAKDQICYQKAHHIIEKFTQDVSEKIIEIMEGKPDLIIGNYTDGNLAAWPKAASEATTLIGLLQKIRSKFKKASREMLESKASAHPFENFSLCCLQTLGLVCTPFLKRTGSQGSSAGNSLLDLRKIELRVKRIKYNGVMDLIADVQAMLKASAQRYKYKSSLFVISYNTNEGILFDHRMLQSWSWKYGTTYLAMSGRPKKGTQYGAPFNEEEWEDDDIANYCSNALGIIGPLEVTTTNPLGYKQKGLATVNMYEPSSSTVACSANETGNIVHYTQKGHEELLVDDIDMMFLEDIAFLWAVFGFRGLYWRQRK